MYYETGERGAGQLFNNLTNLSQKSTCKIYSLVVAGPKSKAKLDTKKKSLWAIANHCGANGS
jgi:hypothetical protein